MTLRLRHSSLPGSPGRCQNLKRDWLLRFYRVPPERTVVFHDELELPGLGWDLRLGGGLGGHRGLKSVEKYLGTRDFFRLRLGIGRPDKGAPAHWVLQPLPPDDLADWNGLCSTLIENLRRL